MQLFYNSLLHPEMTHLALSKDDAKHIVKVLRKKTGDSLNLTDGRGNLYTGVVGLTTSARCELHIAFAKAESPQPYQLHIAIAPTKMNDRMEWFLEKVTEIGVTSITPILCNHSERKNINHERFEKILVSAMQQSLQLHLPVLHELTTYADFINTSQNGTLLIAHCDDLHKEPISQYLSPNTNITILIGPEGDFSTHEIELALHQGYHPVTLGAKRLRTETAGVFAAAAVSFINN